MMRLFTAFIFTIGINLTAAGQVEFGDAQLIYQSDVDIYSAVLVDFDRDGDLDIGVLETEFFVIEFRENRIFWLENSGDGQFPTEHFITSDIEGGTNLIAHDLDGDDDPDLLAGQLLSPPAYCWFENLGDTAFSPLQLIDEAVVNNIQSVSFGLYDLDNDGDQDILPNQRFSPDFRWYERQDSTSFLARDFFIDSTGIVDGSVPAGDLDGDGDLDLIIGKDIGYPPTLVSYFNDGAGNFEPEQIIPDSFASRIKDVVILEMDGDGDQDIAVSEIVNSGPGPEFGRLTIYRNSGTGHFDSAEPVSDYDSEMFRLLNHDLDLDGDQDLILNDFQTMLIHWNDGDGQFSPADTLYHGNIDFASEDAHVIGDLDGDGDPDIVLNIFDDQLIWFENLAMPTGIDAVHNTSMIRAYPNPFLESLTIDLDLEIEARLTVRLTDLSGTVFLEANGLIHENLTIRTVGLPAGMYIIEVANFDSGEILVNGKVVKSN